MDRSWVGDYLDGRTAARHHAIVRVGKISLELVTTTGFTRSWPYNAMTQTQGAYGGEAVRFEYGNEPVESVVIADHSVLTEIRRVASHLPVHFHHPSTRRARAKWTAVAMLVVVVATGLLYQWVIPIISAFLMPLVPVTWEEALGEQLVRHLVPEELRCRDPRLMQALSIIVHPLIQAESSRRYPIRLHVLDDKNINAFAAPGGHVVLLRGLLERTETPEQLAGVLAHELQHVYKRHTTRTIIEQTTGTVLMTALSGDFSGGLTWGIGGAQALSALRYRRAHEEEADLAGLQTMEAARLDSTAMVTFFRILQRELPDATPIPDFLTTHPHMDERIAALTIATHPATGHSRRLLLKEDWTEIRSLCHVETPAR
ncbi:MAG: M48 family metallopeptidase [Nitrospiraceae bacterium]